MSSSRMDRAQWLLVLAACLVGSLSTIGAALPYPILPPLFVGPHAHPVREFLGLPAKMLFGFAVAINPLGLLIGAALLGPLSDRWGRRRTLVLTAGIAALGHVLSAWALDAGAYLPFVVARFITGLAEGNTAVARAMLADRTEGRGRTQAFGWFNSALYMGWLIGPLLAGATLGFGITVPFLIAAGALLLSGLLTLSVLPDDRPIHRAALADPLTAGRQGHALALLGFADIRSVFGLQLLFTLGQTAFYEFYPVWLVEVPGLDTHGLALVTAVLCCVMTSGSVLAGRSHLEQPIRLAALCAAAASLCFMGVALGTAHSGMAAIICAGLPISIYNAQLQAEISRRFGPVHGQGAVMGLVSTVFCVSNVIAAVLGSVLALLDTRAILGVGAVLSAAAALGLWRLPRS